jgi:sucrose phosphorylase
MLSESTEALTMWLAGLDPLPVGCTFLNFIASHDGIGLRPIEDFVDADAQQIILDAVEAVGGSWSNYAGPDGERPYELNVSLADLLAEPDGSQADRFLTAHTIMLAVQGIPAFYIHSLLTTPADHEALARTGHKRDINRSCLPETQADGRVGGGWSGQVFDGLRHVIGVRRSVGAFAPDAAQRVHNLHPQVVALVRGEGDERVLALNNVSSGAVSISLEDFQWLGATPHDLLSAQTTPVIGGQLHLAKWQTRWLRVATG